MAPQVNGSSYSTNGTHATPRGEEPPSQRCPLGALPVSVDAPQQRCCWLGGNGNGSCVAPEVTNENQFRHTGARRRSTHSRMRSLRRSSDEPPAAPSAQAAGRPPNHQARLAAGKPRVRKAGPPISKSVLMLGPTQNYLGLRFSKNNMLSTYKEKVPP